MKHDPPASAPAQPIETTAATVSQGHAETKKKVIVAILLVVLLLALVTQPRQPDDVLPMEKSRLSVPELAVVKTRPGNPGDLEYLDELARTRELSRRGLETLLACRAFEVASADMNGRTDQAPIPSQPRTPVTVRAIYGSDQDQSAIVNDAIIRRGQSLPDGRRVVEVSPRGVALEE